MIVQVNGKVRDRIEVDASIAEEEMEKAAMASARVQEHLAGRTPRNVIIVRPKLVNIVG
jgi:leucyl-tRNA synthetase